MYNWRYPTAIVYMLQSTEYQAGPYLAWYWKVSNFSKVMYRRTLDPTKAARLLLLAARVGIAVQVLAGLTYLVLGLINEWPGAWQFGLALLLAYPIVWAHLIVLPLVLGRIFIVRPREKRLIKQSEGIFRKHPAIKLAIAGSYGKTSMKELLVTILSEGKRVAATPANKNVAISHAYFAKSLTGSEEVLVIEYGEGAPGDVARFARTTHPTHAIITGLAPAHLDKYKTLERAAADIFSVSQYVTKQEHIYVNADSQYTSKYLKPGFNAYSQQAALGWTVEDVHVSLSGTSFTMRRGSDRMQLHSGLLGRHQVGPLALVAALAYEWGLQPAQIAAGMAKTRPYDHRMQPYMLGGAWIIDDTYNGNIEGVRVGTALLRELSAQRKIYVTPGLVDQGAETRAVHEEMGRLIAQANPQVVVLMQNSVTHHIQAGLRAANFSGEVRIEKDPLGFYTSLESFVAAGDVVLMQNDWPDNYR